MHAVSARRLRRQARRAPKRSRPPPPAPGPPPGAFPSPRHGAGAGLGRRLPADLPMRRERGGGRSGGGTRLKGGLARPGRFAARPPSALPQRRPAAAPLCRSAALQQPRFAQRRFAAAPPSALPHRRSAALPQRPLAAAPLCRHGVACGERRTAAVQGRRGESRTRSAACTHESTERGAAARHRCRVTQLTAAAE